MATQINGMSYGDIQHKSGNTVNDVKEIWYKDVNGYAYLIWPDQYWADNIEILEYNGNSFLRTIDYSVDNHGEPIYTVGNNTLSGLKPNHRYVITGSIKRGDGSVEQDVDNCYFFHITTQGSPSGCWSAGNHDNVAIQNNFTGEYDPYGTYDSNDEVTDNLDMEVFLAYHVPQSGGNELKFLGYGHYSANFQNATPIILRRIDIQQELKFYDASTGGSEITGQIQDEPNTTVSLYPKWYKTSSDDNSWSSLETASTNDFSYTISNGCDASVSVSNGVISINIGTTTGYIEFTYGTNDKKTLYLTPASQQEYSLWSGGNIINTTGNNPIVLTQPFSFWIKDVTNNTEYSGNNYTVSVISGDSSAVSISGKTITPVIGKTGQSATIKVVVEGIDAMNGIDVEIGEISVYYKAGKLDSNYNFVNNPSAMNVGSSNNITWNSPQSGDLFGIAFARDSSFTNPLNVYCSVSTAPFYGNANNDNMIAISYSGSGVSSVTFNVYAGTNNTNLLGEFTITES